jgi:hypothetical protein
VVDQPKVVVAKFGSESGNWYSFEGEQIAEVLKADGKGYTRPTLVHARKHQWAPGVTTILNCAHREQLVRWQKEQVAIAACRLPRLDTESDADYIHRLMEASDEVRDVSAEEGTAIHAALQAHFRDEPISANYQPHVDAVTAMLERICGKQAWQSEVAVVSRLGVGTKIDLFSDEWILDHKSKDGDQAKLNGLKAYDNHGMQLAAGRLLLNRPTLRAGIVFQSRTHADACSFVEIPEDKLKRGLAQFKCLLRYWQLTNNFRPDWATETSL